MCCDRISELPDSLLTHILSYLPTKDSVKTSVLSKRWEFLWLKVSGLDLNTMDFLPYGEALLSFMDRFLDFNRGSCLQTFKMKYCRYTEIGYDSSIRLVEWIPELVHRRLQHLVLENRDVPRRLDIMPDCIYMSKTLVSLKLVLVGLKELKFAVSLPCLKILHLENNYFRHDNYLCYKEYVSDEGRSIIENLISGSPVLENVTLEAFIKDLIDWTNVPQCLSSTLEYVRIGVNIMRYKAGIKLVNYFLENSAVLKKLTLSCKNSLTDKREAESYKKLLTSTKLSPRCQVLVD
ncbi:hypothetical protein Bca4012_060585 [Brassica carinata]|uniref:F-box domain-containing protein n=1 Tax=Brassica carinata TaxID=52824 RepID=A0A8X7V637_BRACI|nr:hypothetical protein Bca52824_030917 [Brassica carinata]